MKKLLAILLAMVSVIGLFAGCKPKAPPPRVDGVITIGIPEMLTVEDYDTNAYTLWLEEQTGVDLQFHLFPTSSADYKTQISIMTLDDNSRLPDILMNVEGLGETAWKKYGKEAYFLPLTEYFEDKEGKGKPYWDAVAESGISEAWVNDVLRRCKGDDGEIYAFPRIETTVIDTMDYMPFINQDWLTYLNLDMPTDPESLYNVLKAFKTKDPNQNGFPDEYAMMGGGADSSMGFDIVNWIINMFVYYDDTNYFNLSSDGKTVQVPFNTDGYRQAMIYLNKLHKEGLIDFDMTKDEIKGKLNGTEPVVGIAVGHPTLLFTAGKESINSYTAMPIWGNAVRREYAQSQDCFITEDAADIMDKCWELLCLMCTKEGSYRQRYGEKGVDWVDADEGTKSMLGWDADIKILNDNAYSGNGNETWKEIAACLLPNAENETVQMDENTDPWSLKKFSLLSDIYKNFTAAETKKPTYIMPHIVRTEEDKEATQNERSNCQNIILSYRTKFIKGEVDPNSNAGWQEYLNELKKMGLDAWVAQTQRLYEEGYMASVLDGTYGNW